MATKQQTDTGPGALCIYDECRYCAHRVNARKTRFGEGQCDLELQGRTRVGLCRGRIFFRVSPDRASAYRCWVLGSSARRVVRAPVIASSS